MNIAVYCGSQQGKNPAYMEAARQLGTSIATRGYGLVYGGATIGLMGEVARSALRAGGHVTGVMPDVLVDHEITLHEASLVIMTSTMHERKLEMFDRSQAFIALPGGIGTLEELLEVWTWQKINMHEKPIGLVNTDGYYDALLTFLDEMVERGFLTKEARNTLFVHDNISSLLDDMTPYMKDKTTLRAREQ